MLSPFDAWFARQFGARERGRYEHMLDRDLDALSERGRRAAEELARRRLWDEQESAALNAWQAREETK